MECVPLEFGKILPFFLVIGNKAHCQALKTMLLVKHPMLGIFDCHIY